MNPFIRDAIEGDPTSAGTFMGGGRVGVSVISPFMTATASSISLSYLAEGEGDNDERSIDPR